MKILFVDSTTTGHHTIYLKWLASQWDCNDIAAIVPNEIEGLSCPQFVIKCTNIWKFKHYIKWILQIRKIIHKEKPEIVHFVYADPFYKYFGLGIPKANSKIKIIFTWHVIKISKLRDFSERFVLKKASFCVVHTSSIHKHFTEKLSQINIRHIEYPQFCELPQFSQNYSRKVFSLPIKIPIIACVGATRFNKGLDIIMDALCYLKKEFHLLIAGKDDYFSIYFIDQKTLPYRNKVTKCIRYISDEEFFHAINAADIIALPYRKTFDGASGPLVEGVLLNKLVIGPSHGSLRSIIEDNHIGYTFESENVLDLARVLDKAIDEKFVYDSKALEYQNSLSPKIFLEKYKSLYDTLL